jgi:hypothetical protein
MTNLISKIHNLYPTLDFEKSNLFYYSSSKNKIYYSDILTTKDKWSFLHEVGHALLNHKQYNSDFSLLKMEIEAWEKAKKIAKKFKINIAENHIQDCLDSYRDWIYKRSLCPVCKTSSFQDNLNNCYLCINCNTKWITNKSKLCRLYRKKLELKN